MEPVRDLKPQPERKVFLSSEKRTFCLMSASAEKPWASCLSKQTGPYSIVHNVFVLSACCKFVSLPPSLPLHASETGAASSLPLTQPKGKC